MSTGNLTTPSATAPIIGPSAYTDLAGLASLKAHSRDPQALKAVAQQFESLFFEMMLKSMRSASLGDGVFDSDEGKLYQEMFDKQISVSMAKKQGFGIADLLLRQLSPPPPVAQAKNLLTAVTRRTGANAAQTAPSAARGDDGDLRASLSSLLASLGNSSPLDAGQVQSDSAPVLNVDTPPAQSSQGFDASTPQQFVASLLPLAKQAASFLGVSPLGIIAQAALETGWGQRLARLADGTPSFNLFGIKAGPSWQGGRVGADTLEFVGAAAEKRRESFRAYESVGASVEDYTRLIHGSPRYQQALAVGADPRAYAEALSAAGYATDPDYAKKIIEILNGDALKSALSALKK
jgi:peptidoglycan hydrolase FlgJ